MLEFLERVFGHVCSQTPGHVWAPGGEWMACCQRCAGLYIGALIAVMLQGILRPRPTAPMLWLYGLLLLQMAPFGLHWVPQGPWLRAVSGQLFAFGVVGFLWLWPEAHGRRRSASGENRNLLSNPQLGIHSGATQIWNLLYRRFVIGRRTPASSAPVTTSQAKQVGNLRYGRLEVCATKKSALPQRPDVSEVRLLASSPTMFTGRKSLFLAAAAASIILLPVVSQMDWPGMAQWLSLLAFAGLISLVLLAGYNLVLAATDLVHWLRQHQRNAPA